ncbi:response regulator [Herbaspirillum sp. RTI4]|uniref:response regulator n=1 Tax=Herbaspirillum sp. RTI4 TaxID=3048640 RepID=UPI002AB403EB|nr:response regulator [Herbaspirillum sp. RTI4]MDY7577924.1 response regulator [Herbaspirillum sp. RTI4]MEA9981630.1 response regulator [Herbaspirillum sp. RTI4]
MSDREKLTTGKVMPDLLTQTHENDRTTVSYPTRIFLVEDSPDVRDLIVENLAEIPGVELVGFSETEADAVQQLQHAPCDVVILDIQLKEGNGMRVLQTLSRLEPSRLQEPIKIIFSNHVSSTYRQVGMKYGVEFFFDKSSEAKQLRTLIEQICRHEYPLGQEKPSDTSSASCAQ